MSWVVMLVIIVMLAVAVTGLFVPVLPIIGLIGLVLAVLWAIGTWVRTRRDEVPTDRARPGQGAKRSRRQPPPARR